MSDQTPSAKDIAEAQRVNAALEKKQATLAKRKEHLEQSIEGLPDDAEAGDAQWFADELRRTEAEMATVTNRLTDIDAAVQAQKIRGEEEQHSDLIRIYDEAKKQPGGIGQMNPALRKRVLRAVREDAERRLESDDNPLGGGRRLGA